MRRLLCHNPPGMKKKCNFWLDHNAVYSINEGIPQYDKIFYCNFFGKYSVHRKIFRLTNYSPINFTVVRAEY